MNDDTPRLLRYTKLGSTKLRDGELWMAIVQGSPGKGGDGVIVHGRAAPMVTQEGLSLTPPRDPGDAFKFAANSNFQADGSPLGDVVREVWGLDAVPDEVAASWMKFKHQGKLNG